MAAFVLGSVSLVQDMRSGNADRDKICRVAEHSNTTLRRLLTLAQRNSQISLRAHPAQLAASQRFYRQALDLLKPVDCEKL